MLNDAVMYIKFTQTLMCAAIRAVARCQYGWVRALAVLSVERNAWNVCTDCSLAAPGGSGLCGARQLVLLLGPEWIWFWPCLVQRGARLKAQDSVPGLITDVRTYSCLKYLFKHESMNLNVSFFLSAVLHPMLTFSSQHSMLRFVYLHIRLFQLLHNL